MTDPTSSSAPKPPAASSDEPVLRPHTFDGIQEFDQRLPNWWLMTFYFAIIWFLLYWTLYYQGGFFQSDSETVTAQIAGILMGFLTPMMFFAGGLFAVIWLVTFVLGRRLESRTV